MIFFVSLVCVGFWSFRGREIGFWCWVLWGEIRENRRGWDSGKELIKVSAEERFWEMMLEADIFLEVVFAERLCW